MEKAVDLGEFGHGWDDRTEFELVWEDNARRHDGYVAGRLIMKEVIDCCVGTCLAEKSAPRPQLLQAWSWIGLDMLCGCAEVLTSPSVRGP